MSESPGKKILEKKPENKNFKKSLNFLKSLEIKSWVLDSWDFFHKRVWGLPTYLKKKKTKKKSPESCENEIKSKTFSKKRLFYASVLLI